MSKCYLKRPKLIQPVVDPSSGRSYLRSYPTLDEYILRLGQDIDMGFFLLQSRDICESLKKKILEIGQETAE